MNVWCNFEQTLVPENEKQKKIVEVLLLGIVSFNFVKNCPFPKPKVTQNANTKKII